MKQLLILIVAAAVYFHFYPNEELNNWLAEQKETALSIFSETTDTSVRLSTNRVYKDIERSFDKFTTREQKYVAEITATRDSVVKFYDKHCTGKKQSPKLHRDNLKTVCQVMGNYSKFF
ncbi:MAG: hypothetical protein ACPG52_11755 [Cognaticolwellia sp.]